MNRLPSPYRSRAIRLCAALMVGTALTGLGAAPALGQQASGASAARAFAISSQPLVDAMREFSRVTGIQVAYTASVGSGVVSPGVSGSFAPAEALSRLLTGTGLTFRFTGPNAVTLEPAPQTSGDAIQLGPVRVEGAAQAGTYVPPPQAEIGNLPSAYAGGQVARGGKLGILGNRDMMDTPFNQTSYTAELMQNQQVQRISEALGNDPSVRSANSASSGIDEFAIRGFNVSNTDVLFNGLTGVAPSFANAMMAESVERVEVLKGPSAFLNGAAQSGSIGGAINVVPKRAGSDPLTEVTLGYAADSQFGGHVDVGRRFGSEQQWGVRFNGVYRDGDTAIDNQSRRSILAAFGLDYQGERLRVSADLGYQDQDLDGVRTGLVVFGGFGVPDAPRSRNNFSDPFEFSRSEVYYGTVRAEYDLADRVTLFAAAGGNRRSQEWWTARFSARFITNAQGDLAAGSRELMVDRMNAHTFETGIVGRFETGPVGHQVTLSHTRLDRNWRRGIGTSLSPIVASNIYRPTYTPDIYPVPDVDDIRRISDLQLNSTSLVDTLTFLDERVILTVGARLQQIDSRNFNRLTGAVTSGYDEDKVTPMVGLVVKPSSRLSLYANYIEGLQQGAQAPSTAANAGEIFPPYVTKQYEIGGKLDFGQFGATLAVYQVAQPSAFIDSATNIFGIDGEQRHRGIDLNLFGEIAEGVRLLGGVAYIDSKLTKTQGGLNEGNRGVGTPKWNAVLGAEWDVPFATGLTVTGRVNHSGSQFLDPENMQELQSWTRVDIGARYRIDYAGGKAVTIRANLNNVFDKDYWQTVSGALEGLGDPRTFRLSATIEF